MKSMACTISYGKTAIDYELLMMNRRTLEIAVHPDKSVVVKAPASSGMQEIEARLRKRARWIRKQRAYFDQFMPRTPARGYVGGEGHLYLGRKYRLRITPGGRDAVLLKNGYFYIDSSDTSPACIQAMLDGWYKQRAQIHLTRAFDECWQDFEQQFKRQIKQTGIEKPQLELQTMQRRWGSLSGKGRLTLNLLLIQAPRACIDYVVIHELCHLIHRNHGAAFYKLLACALPDWMRCKHKLETTLA